MEVVYFKGVCPLEPIYCPLFGQQTESVKKEEVPLFLKRITSCPKCHNFNGRPSGFLANLDSKDFIALKDYNNKRL